MNTLMTKSVVLSPRLLLTTHYLMFYLSSFYQIKQNYRIYRAAKEECLSLPNKEKAYVLIIYVCDWFNEKSSGFKALEIISQMIFGPLVKEFVQPCL